MAGVNSNQVYLLGPDQSSTVGAIYTAPVGTTKPTDARTALPNTWASGGYISESGITLNISRSNTSIKDWGLNNVRVATTDFGCTITGEFLQIDEAAAKNLVGAANVSKTAASTTHGEQLTISIGPDLPPEQAFCINMKDGNRRGRICAPNAQVTEVGSPTFVPSAGNVWPFTISCYDDGTGHSVYVYFDDGATTA